MMRLISFIKITLASFATLIFHKAMYRHVSRMEGYLTIDLARISWRVWQSERFENRPTFDDEIMTKTRFPHGVVYWIWTFCFYFTTFRSSNGVYPVDTLASPPPPMSTHQPQYFTS